MAGRFVAYGSQGKAGAKIAFFGGLLALFVWGPSYGFEFAPGWEWARWPFVALFGFLCLSELRELFDDRPQIMIDKQGIMMPKWSDRLIPWSAIREVVLAKQYSRWPFYNRWICLNLHDPAAHRHTTRRGRWFTGNFNLGSGDVVMMTPGADRDIDEVLAAIERYATPAGIPIIKGYEGQWSG